MIRLPPVTLALLIANILIYALQQMLPPGLVDSWFALFPIGDFGPDWPHFQVWQLVTYAFLHGNTLHIAFNMFGLYMFGPEIERLFGTRRFVIYYFLCVVGAAAAQLLVAKVGNLPPTPVVGASGALFGLLLAFGMAYPKRMIMLIFPPIPMRAWFFVTAYGLIELFLGITGTQEGVAHFAHLGGMLTGLVAISYWKARGVLVSTGN